MTVPRHDAAGLDRQLAEAQLAVMLAGCFSRSIEAERHVGDADRLVINHFAGVRLHLAGRTFAGDGCRSGRHRTGDDAGKREALSERTGCKGGGIAHSAAPAAAKLISLLD